MQKRNDYNRHKLLRKIRRQRRAQVEQQKVAAEKELKRRLRVTPPKFGDGKEPTLLDADKVRMNEQGLFQDETGNIVGDSVVLPELTVRAHKGYKSAYDREMLDNTIGTALDFTPGIGDAKQGTEALDALNKRNYEEAVMLGGLLLLPNVIEKPLKYVGRGLKRYYGHLKNIPGSMLQDAMLTDSYKKLLKDLPNIQHYDDVDANTLQMIADLDHYTHLKDPHIGNIVYESIGKNTGVDYGVMPAFYDPKIGDVRSLGFFDMDPNQVLKESNNVFKQLNKDNRVALVRNLDTSTDSQALLYLNMLRHSNEGVVTPVKNMFGGQRMQMLNQYGRIKDSFKRKKQMDRYIDQINEVYGLNVPHTFGIGPFSFAPSLYYIRK